MAKEPKRNEDQTSDAPTVINPGATPPAAPVEKKPRKPRSPSAPKGPQLTPDDLRAFADHTANELAAARKDDTVTDEALGVLFARNQKLKAMIGGGNVSA